MQLTRLLARPFAPGGHGSQHLMALPHVWHRPARGSALVDSCAAPSVRAMAVAAVGGSITAASTASTESCAPAVRVARSCGTRIQRNVPESCARRPAYRSFLPLAPFVATQLESTLGSDEPLLLLVDFTVNDGYTIAGNEYKYSKGATAQMRAEVGHIARALEQLLRHLQPRRANVAIVGALHACAPCALLRDDYVKLFRHYEAPLLELTTWPKCSRWNFARCVHPNASWHSQLAATVVDGLRERALCRAAQEAPAAAGSATLRACAAVAGGRAASRVPARGERRSTTRWRRRRTRAAPRSHANGRPAAGCTLTGRTSPGGSSRRRSPASGRP